MLLTADVLRDMGGTIALLSLLSVAYGSLMRVLEREAVAQATLGALFGGASVLALQSPMRIADGVMVDLRNVPVVLAGAFLGWPGAAVAASMAMAARIEIGGAGMVAGVPAILVSAVIGLGWAGWQRRRPTANGGVPLLAAMSLGQFGTFVFLPWSVARQAVATVWPVLVPLHLAGVLVVGSLLVRERALVAAERRLALAASRDPLTGLLNRRGFEAAVAGLARGPHGAAVLLLDLDHFKRINDAHGHAGGDAVLRQVGPRLLAALRPADVVGRFGGEEVIVYLHAIGADDARAAAERLAAALRAEPFGLPGGGSLRVTASVGGAWTRGPVALDELEARADAALYAAKAAGRDRCRFDARETVAEVPSVPAPLHRAIAT